jgi:UDP-N-acetylglucosamine 2-epimerase (non-hydrolysing)
MFMHVVGARPNFMKAAPVMAAFKNRGWQQTLIHTGQHYDELMSETLFRQLKLPAPDINLGVGSGTHAEQTGAVLTAVEKVLIAHRPDVVVVYGDVNSTMAATLAAAKLHIPVAHVEAGLRSFDRTMPEEINRLVTDQLAAYLFTPSPDGDANLIREGVAEERIFRVGNVMIDTLVACMPLVDAAAALARLKMSPGDPFVLVTLHRPANVDTPVLLDETLSVLSQLSMKIPVVFPMHPRTRARVPFDSIQSAGGLNLAQGLRGDRTRPARLHLIDPLGYLEFLALQKHARLVITDSGGVQEETTYLGVPCLTVRQNTERPVTITEGTNELVGTDPKNLLKAAFDHLSRPRPSARIPDLWDGHAAERIADVFVSRPAG